MTTNEIELIIAGLHGWCWVEKAMAMCDLIRDTKPRHVVEIGVFGGRSLIPMAMQLKQVGMPAKIYGVDPWTKDHAVEGTNDPANNEWWKSVDMEDIYRGFLAAIYKHNVQAWVEVMRMTSEQASQMIQEVDILHLDGNHSEDVSCRDVTLWLPKIKPGGYIWMDDTNWFSTAKAQQLLDAACDRIKDVATCRLYRKR